ncbi:MAG: elongation factor G [Oscillospiraceae bacterium]|nr:elongation factor G [Oscillospiraceae bacterium]
MKFDYTHIKNIAIVGHHGSGKTSLVESLLFKSGAISQLGKIESGNTVSDFKSEEIKRKSSVYTSLSSTEYNGFKYNILDTPGVFDFIGEQIEAISAADSVIITVSGKSGVKVGTHKAYDRCVEMKKPHMFVVTKLDDENANFNNVLTSLKAEFGPSVCPVVVPVISNNSVLCYVNLIEMKAYKYENGSAIETDMPTSEVSEKMGYRIDGLIEAMSEAVAETDEDLFEKFFSGEKFTQKELIDGIHKGVNEGIITPVTCVAATDMSGVDMLLKEMELLLPTSSETDSLYAEDETGNICEIKCDNNSPLCAKVFKTSIDPYIGKMSYVKVLSGSIKTGMTIICAETEEKEKVGKLVTLKGKEQKDIDEISCGDIGVIIKSNAQTNSTICQPEKILKYNDISFPKGYYCMSVKPVKQGDESKISSAMSKILDEDRTLTFETNPTTNEQILSGLGEQHLASVVYKLKELYNVEVELKNPKIAYKETIRKKAKVQGKHKKQSGGHGQYGDVWIEFEPYISDDIVFEEKVVGGAVPKNFFPAIEKGIRETMQSGILGGFPVCGVKAVLLDGSYHPVDSSEMAFKIAASMASKEGMRLADPVLLEPIGKLEVILPEENTGDLIGDLNKRRGRILSMEPLDKKGYSKIVADVPEREMSDFTTVLKSITQGAGSFTYIHERYEQLPQQLLKDVLLQN